MLMRPQLLAQHRSMECAHDPPAGDEQPARRAESVAPAPTPEPEEKAKRTKHTRVQKREKELYGLVTPVFLPLLDARDPEKKKPRTQRPDAPIAAIPEHATPAGETSTEARTSRREHTAMEGPVAGGSTDVSKKTKRASTPTKKSALRQQTATKPRRKRVSLVIDGQTVLPADTVLEHPLMSPSSEATSASNSTASLDDMIDPRLIKPESPTRIEHHDAVHHSLPRSMSSTPHMSSLPKTNTDTPKIPPTSTSTKSQTSTMTPESTRSPPTQKPKQAPILPAAPSPTLPDPSAAEPIGQPFNTYVGGLRGSGADDVDQAGSYGYPSSLGASYMESYMQSRPLRVRMETAERAGLEGEEKRVMVEERVDDMEDDEAGLGLEEAKEVGNEDADGDDFMGEMEDF
jgi:hypothetical protein